MSTGLEIPIPLYRPVRFGSVLPGFVGLLRVYPRVFSCLVRAYTHPSGDNCGDKECRCLISLNGPSIERCAS
jgi:hypothetical protein